MEKPNSTSNRKIYVPSSGCGACSTSDLLTASRRTTGLFSGPARSSVGSVVDLDDTVKKQYNVGNAGKLKTKKIKKNTIIPIGTNLQNLCTYWQVQYGCRTQGLKYWYLRTPDQTPYVYLLFVGISASAISNQYQYYIGIGKIFMLVIHLFICMRLVSSKQE